MAGLKGNFKFMFDSMLNGVRVIPFRKCIDFKGKKAGIKYCLEAQIGININTIQLREDDYIHIRFDAELDAAQTNLMNSIISEYKIKDTYTAIEEIAISWHSAQYPVRDILPVIEDQLQALYDVAVWSNLSWSEKRILAFWRVCTDVEALEVFTQAELDANRWYVMYKYLDPSIRATLTCEDIHVAPKTLDFTTQFENRHYKRTLSLQEGRPTTVEYYGEYDDQTFTYSDKFAQIDFSFVDDPATNLILRKIANLSWTWNTGEQDLVDTKDIGKIYHPQFDIKLRLEEARMKRRNIYENIQATVIGMIVGTTGMSASDAEAQGVDFLQDHEVEFTHWLEFGSNRQAELVAVLVGADVNTYAWIDNDLAVFGLPGITIRMYAINEISIA